VNFDTIIEVEKFIENLNHPRKQAIARELVVNTNFQVFRMTLSNKTDFFLKENQSGNTYQLLTYINSQCNCG